MTYDETIKGLNAVKEECGKHLDESFAWIGQPIDAAIEALKTDSKNSCLRTVG